MLTISSISFKVAKAFYTKSSSFRFRYDSIVLLHSTVIRKKQAGDNSSSGAISTINISWINSRYIPAKFRPYLNLIRADKQTGTMLLLWPCWWSIALATPMGQLPSLIILFKFSLGALLMRSGKSVKAAIFFR